MDKRKYSRVVFETTAKIKKDDQSIKGTVENLSLKGAYIKTDSLENINSEDVLKLNIELTGSSSNLNLKLDAKVKRKSEDGFGVEFISIDLDSFTHLKNIIAYNSGEYEKVLKEFEESSKK